MIRGSWRVEKGKYCSRLWLTSTQAMILTINHTQFEARGFVSVLLSEGHGLWGGFPMGAGAPSGQDLLLERLAARSYLWPPHVVLRVST